MKCDEGYRAPGDTENTGKANCLDGIWKSATNTSVVLKDEGDVIDFIYHYHFYVVLINKNKHDNVIIILSQYC